MAFNGPAYGAACSLVTEAMQGGGAIQGQDGKSAYELAVQQGFSGTLDEWLASLGGNSSQGSSSNIYSETETLVGEWLGEPLYRIVTELEYTSVTQTLGLSNTQQRDIYSYDNTSDETVTLLLSNLMGYCTVSGDDGLYRFSVDGVEKATSFISWANSSTYNNLKDFTDVYIVVPAGSTFTISTDWINTHTNNQWGIKFDLAEIDIAVDQFITKTSTLQGKVIIDYTK